MTSSTLIFLTPAPASAAPDGTDGGWRKADHGKGHGDGGESADDAFHGIGLK